MGAVAGGEPEPVILVSPTEPAELRSIGTSSPAVEAKGCDVLIVLPELRIGIQRKTWVDLVISLDDGRLANSIPKMDMAVRCVILEGKNQFDSSGHMIVRSRNRKKAVAGWAHLRHTKESLAGVMFSLRYTHGLDVFLTENLAETIMIVERIGKYLAKSNHKGIVGDRPRVQTKDQWGVDDAQKRRIARRVNLLMSMGVGFQTATNILKANGGKIPIQWTVSREELLRVPLVGPSVVEKLMDSIG